MTKHLTRRQVSSAGLTKRDSAAPVIKAAGRDKIVIKAGTRFRGVHFRKEAPVAPPVGGYVAGTDYCVCVTRGVAEVRPLDGDRLPANAFAGFHFAPGGNATADKGGDAIAAINRHSIWDRKFRPACRDVRGMTRVVTAAGSFWCDIYLTGTQHKEQGTSRLGATIADGRSLSRFDYAAAVEAMKLHDKSLLGAEEFFAAALGVTERTAADGDPVVTKLDAPRTSVWGVIQATGSMWTWGTDGHPTLPRASLFGGSWWSGEFAGSRCANLGHWPGDSDDGLGARGRCDHLQLA